MNRHQIYTMALKKYGAKNQMLICAEELNEAAAAILQKHRGRRINVQKEIADVEITIEQMKIVFGKDKLEKYKNYKLNRLLRRMKKASK